MKPSAGEPIIDDSFKVEWFSGTGAGGQHRNKAQNSCRVIHIPTGLSETRQSRSRTSNYDSAKKALIHHLTTKSDKTAEAVESVERKSKLGSGMRGDKFITIQFQNNKATHHKTEKTCRASDFMDGKMDLLW